MKRNNDSEVLLIAITKRQAHSETWVLVSTRKFRDLETTIVGDEIEELPQIDRIPRELQIAEVSEALSMQSRA